MIVIKEKNVYIHPVCDFNNLYRDEYVAHVMKSLLLVYKRLGRGRKLKRLGHQFIITFTKDNIKFPKIQLFVV